MSQGPLCPNLSQKVQKEVSQMANCNSPHVMLEGGLSVNLNHLKMNDYQKDIPRKMSSRKEVMHEKGNIKKKMVKLRVDNKQQGPFRRSRKTERTKIQDLNALIELLLKFLPSLRQ